MSFAEGQYEPWTCPACGREAPATFDLCWYCGGDRAGEAGVELTPDEPSREAGEAADDPGPLYRRMHRRTALTLVWAAGAWFAAMAGSGLLTALIGPDGHGPWTRGVQLVAAATGLAFAIAVGATLALIAFVFSPLWENYGAARPAAADDAPLAATPEALGFRADRGGRRDRHAPSR